MKQRAKLVPGASGVVLDVGTGAGPNLQFYDPAKVTRVIGAEPSAGMRRKAAKAIQAAPVAVELVDAGAEALPLADDSVDTAVLTFTLCSIPDPGPALAEIRRVLKPEGRLLFCEHGLAPDEGVAKWQKRLEPVWKRIAGGCHLARPMDRLIEGGGFAITRLEAGYIPGTPKFAGYDYLGEARPA